MNKQDLILVIINNGVPIVLVLIVFFRVVLPVLTIMAHIIRLLLIIVRDFLSWIVRLIPKQKSISEKKEDRCISLNDQVKVVSY